MRTDRVRMAPRRGARRASLVLIALAAFGSPVASGRAEALVPIDCNTGTDDPGAIQAQVNAAVPGDVIVLSGTCDFTQVPAHGGDLTSIEAAGVVIRPGLPANDLTIQSANPASPAVLLGAGTQTAFFVGPGSSDVTIRGLRFENFGRPIVVTNASGTTIGAETLPPSGPSPVPDPAGNRIVGAAGMSAGVLAVARDRGTFDAAGTYTVAYPSSPTPAVFTITAGQGLTGTDIIGNAIFHKPPGVASAQRRITGVEIGQAGGRVADFTEIRNNAIGLFAADFGSFDMNAVRVEAANATQDAPTSDGFYMRRVDIWNNNLGRIEELDQTISGINPGDTHGGGRAAVVAVRVGTISILDNRVRARLSPTALPTPGGGIIVADSSIGAVVGNDVLVLADPSTADADLGGIGLVDDVLKLFSGAGGPPTERIRVTDNEIGAVVTNTGFGVQRGLVLNGAQRSTVARNVVGFPSGPPVSIGVTARGPGSTSNPGPKTLRQPVLRSVVCDNDLDGAVDDPAAVVVGAGTPLNTANAFPGGALYTGNFECPPTVNTTRQIVGLGEDLGVSGKAWAQRPLTVMIEDAASTAVTHSTSADSGGSYTTTFTSTELSGLVDGDLTVTVTTSDDLGTGLTRASAATVRKATAGTGSGSVNISDGDGYMNLAESKTGLNVAWSSGDPGAATADIWFETSAGSIPVGCGPFTGAPATGNGKLNKTCAGNLPQGAFFVKALWRDAGGSPSTSVSDSSIKDTVAPPVTVVSVTDPINANNAASTSASGQTEAGAGIRVTASVSHAIMTASVAGTVGGSGAWSATGIDVRALPDCPVTFTAVATDVAGNTASAKKVAQKDTQVALTISTVTDPVNPGNETAVSASGTTDPSSSVAVSITDGAATAGPANVTAGTDGTWQATLNASSLSDGQVTYQVTATDPGGNVASATRNATKSTSGLMAGTVTILDGDGFVSGSEVTNGVPVSWTAGDAAAVSATIWFEAFDGSIPPACGPFVGAQRTANAKMNKTCATNMPQGLFYFKAYWSAGGGPPSAVAQDSSIKDTIAPGAPSVLITDGDGYVTETEVTAVSIGGVGDPSSVVDLVVSDTSATTPDVVASVAVALNGTWGATLNLAGLAQGPITASASARDGALNRSGTVQDSSTLDVQTPSSTWRFPSGIVFPAPIVILPGTSTDSATEIVRVDVVFTNEATSEVVTAEATLQGDPGRTRDWLVNTSLSIGTWKARPEARDQAGHIELAGPELTIIVVP